MTYWRCHYHLVWATKQRLPMIDDGCAEVLQRSFRATAHHQSAIIHAIGIMPDHVHLAVSVPPKIAVATFVKDLKGSSSHLVNRSVNHRVGDWFAWQAEYGVLTIGDRSLDDVMAYVENQKAHHVTNQLRTVYELVDRPLSERSSVLSPGGTS